MRTIITALLICSIILGVASSCQSLPVLPPLPVKPVLEHDPENKPPDKNFILLESYCLLLESWADNVYNLYSQHPPR